MRFPGTPVLAAVALAITAGVGVPLMIASSSSSHGRIRPDPHTAAVTTFPGLVPPTAEPTLPSITSAHPSTGTVIQAAGPFDDRFVLAGLRLERGVVRGTLTVTSDVSEVIDLQVLVGFFDRRGSLLGTGTYEKHGEGARPNEVVTFRVAAPPAVAGSVVAAAAAVPVLVNE